MGAFRIIIIACITALVISTIPLTMGEDTPEDPGDIKEWTFMVYLDCDNNLESAGIEDLNEMETVGSTDDVNIIVQMDRCAVEGYDTSNGDWTGAKRYYVTADEDTSTIGSEEVEDLGEINMGDPKTLADFVNWTVDNYTAEKYALVLWNHGGAFWGVCWDEDNEDDRITMPELKSALAHAEDHLGRDIDLVGFDACLMAQMGVMYQIRNSVDFGVASGYVEPGEGWPYEKILPYLRDDPGMSPKNLGKVISDEYVASYTDQEGDPDDTPAVTQAVFDLKKLDDLAYKIDMLSMILSSKAGSILGGGHNVQIREAREITNSYDFGTQYCPSNAAPIDPTGYCMYDVIDLMDNMMDSMPLDSEVVAAANSVKSSVGEAVVHYAVNPYHEAKGAHGFTLYFPSGLDTTYDEKFDELDFAQDTYWDDFLHYYHNAENAQNTPPGISILSPLDDELADKGEMDSIQLQGSAYDVQGDISLIEVKIDDGEWVAVGASDRWHYDVPLFELENGEHTFSARAYDGSEHSAEDSVKIFVVGEKVEGEKQFPVSMVLLAAALVIIAIVSVAYLRKKKR